MLGAALSVVFFHGRWSTGRVLYIPINLLTFVPGRQTLDADLLPLNSCHTERGRLPPAFSTSASPYHFGERVHPAPAIFFLNFSCGLRSSPCSYWAALKRKVRGQSSFPSCRNSGGPCSYLAHQRTTAGGDRHLFRCGCYLSSGPVVVRSWAAAGGQLHYILGPAGFAPLLLPRLLFTFFPAAVGTKMGAHWSHTSFRPRFTDQQIPFLPRTTKTTPITFLFIFLLKLIRASPWFLNRRFRDCSSPQRATTARGEAGSVVASGWARSCLESMLMFPVKRGVAWAGLLCRSFVLLQFPWRWLFSFPLGAVGTFLISSANPSISASGRRIVDGIGSRHLAALGRRNRGQLRRNVGSGYAKIDNLCGPFRERYRGVVEYLPL